MIWKDIEGYKGKYQISDEGKVRSLNYCNTGKIKELKPHINKKTGLYEIELSKNNKKKSFMIARLVADAFIPNKNRYEYVIHLNGDLSDNTVENLKWGFKSESNFLMYKNKKRKTGTPSDYIFSYKGKKCRRLTEIADDYKLTRRQFSKRLERGWSIEEIVCIPVQEKNKGGRPRIQYEYYGEWYSVKELAEKLNKPERLIRKRLARGWSTYECEIPARRRGENENQLQI